MFNNNLIMSIEHAICARHSVKQLHELSQLILNTPQRVGVINICIFYMKTESLESLERFLVFSQVTWIIKGTTGI